MGEIIWDDSQGEGGGAGGGGLSNEFSEGSIAADGVPLSYVQFANRTNVVGLTNLFTLTPPAARALVITGLFTDIVCAGTGTILTILVNGAVGYQWTSAGGVLALSLTGPAIIAGGAGEVIQVRVGSDATRTSTNVTATFAVVRP